MMDCVKYSLHVSNMYYTIRRHLSSCLGNIVKDNRDTLMSPSKKSKVKTCPYTPGQGRTCYFIM